MKHLLLGAGLLLASASLVSADVWTTTEPDGRQARTVVRDPQEPARDYSSNNGKKFYPSQTTTITRGAQVPDNVNQLRPRRDNQTQITVGTFVPVYPYYPYPYYPQPQYYFPPTYTPLTPHAGIVTSGGYGAGYPYGYVPANPYSANPYPVNPYPYPYVQAPSWNFYGYDGPAGGYGSYDRSTTTTGGGLTIGGGGIRGSIGSSRTTTRGSFSTF